MTVTEEDHMAEDTEPFDPDTLPPTAYLVMEVLAARWRLGESCWTFPNTVRPALVRLERDGLVRFQRSPAPGCQLVWITDAGKDAWLDPTYVEVIAPHTPTPLSPPPAVFGMCACAECPCRAPDIVGVVCQDCARGVHAPKDALQTTFGMAGNSGPNRQ